MAGKRSHNHKTAPSPATWIIVQDPDQQRFGAYWGDAEQDRPAAREIQWSDPGSDELIFRVKNEFSDALVARPLGDFLSHPYPPAEYLIRPWFRKRALGMVFAWRGTGKTYWSLTLAFCLSIGAPFVGFDVLEPRKVLYVDGEMDPVDVQEILSHLKAAAAEDGFDVSPADINLRVLTHADQEFGIPDLSNPEDDHGRRMIEAVLGDAEVLILDNMSTLCTTGIENDGESWATMQRWLVALRRKDKSVLVIHHTGKPNKQTGKADQRGTSKREDALNFSIQLSKPPGDFGCFSVEFTKNRGFKPPEKFGVVIQHEKEAERCRLIKEAEDEVAAVEKLLEAGKTQKDIAELLGKSEPTISRIVNRKVKPRQAAREAMAEAWETAKAST
jgi:putative DNA primase/helicase